MNPVTRRPETRRVQGRIAGWAGLGLLLALATAAGAGEYHVSPAGDDGNPGTRRRPLRTIQRAADLAQPGDTVTVHEGLYRERVNPPRGGESDARRIVYRAARGAKAEIRGSEVIKGWVRVQDDVWNVTLPNTFFGDFNPYRDLIRGDWFDPRGRPHHTGAVYLDGEWLTEAASLEEVLMPRGTKPAWLLRAGTSYLLNLAWLQAGTGTRIPAAAFAAQQGVQTAACSEGGECLGWIEAGDWVRYEGVDLAPGTDRIEFRAASATEGGRIEVRLDGPTGELLGAGEVGATGDWQSWSTVSASIRPVGGLRTLCLVFLPPASATGKDRGLNPQLWFGKVEESTTTLWAQFEGVDPNERLVEINVRRTVFYPDQPGRNYLTVRGFILRHAATPWAPPTAEQVGLIGTHWSRGWIIEDNVISHSVCSGIALGKHGDAYDNTSADTAEGYVQTIERAHAFSIPWTKEHIGHHIVRRNTISHCEQAGIVGSLGCSFSTVTDNVIHDVHIRRLFSGAEMAGIKFHGAIDTTIRRNHIYRTCQGLWLDWMAQGARVTGNLFHDNEDRDLFLEVNHGPHLIDNNFFLSPTSLLDVSEGGAFVHNLFAGRIVRSPEPNRDTPFLLPHRTTVAGLRPTKGGDNRFYGNLFVAPPAAGASPNGLGLNLYDRAELPCVARGNVYWNGTRPHASETASEGLVRRSGPEPAVRWQVEGASVSLHYADDGSLRDARTPLVTSAVLGRASVPDAAFEKPDGSAWTIRTDYLGRRRAADQPTPGPIETPGTDPIRLTDANGRLLGRP